MPGARFTARRTALTLVVLAWSRANSGRFGRQAASASGLSALHSGITRRPRPLGGPWICRRAQTNAHVLSGDRASQLPCGLFRC